jgi:predicted Zn-dependent peptidase
VAHFLEHKLFDTPDGDAFNKLAESGAQANAYTSSEMTAYYFESTDKFERNLEILLDFVSVPYFTEASVAKEQGIIGQEIRMTEDEPDYVCYYGLLRSLFPRNTIRDSIVGTEASIARITPETLYNCHKVFYNPSNMALIVAGDVEPDRVAELAERILPRGAGELPMRDYGATDELTPASRSARRAMEVSRPLFYAGGAARAVGFGQKFQRREVLGRLACEVLFGKSSPLYIRLYGEGLVSQDFGASFESAAGIAFTMFGGQSRDPDAVFAASLDEIRRVSAAGIDAEVIARVKKALFGWEMRALNSFSDICRQTAAGYFRDFDAFRTPEALMNASEDEIMAFIKEDMNPDDMAISIIEPKAGDGA